MQVHHQIQQQAPIVDTTIRRVKCTFPGCSKQFNRKEHLTRHLKSHDPQRQYQCPICGRRYARSDVWKRHVEHHSQDTHSTRTLVACVSCHERKLKCDDGVPCQSCIRNSVECSRVRLDRETRTSMSLDIDEIDDDDNGHRDGNENNVMGGDGQILANRTSSMLPNDDHQQPWFQSAKEKWLSTFPPPGPNAPYSPDDPIAGNLAHWAEGSDERGPVDGVLSVVEPEDTSSLLLTSNHPQVVSLPSAYRRDVDQGYGTASSLVSQSPASTRLSQADRTSDLRRYLSKEPLTTQRLVEAYFAKVHPHWPILHAPTFDIAKTSDNLLGSMILLASWLEGVLDHVELVPLVFNAVTVTVLESNPSFADGIESASLHTLQALLLCVVYTMCCLTAEGISARAVHFNSILVANCRHLGVFSGQYKYHDLEESPSTFWLAQEQLHRLAFCTLRADAYLSILLDHPPTVRYQEICTPLPKSSRLWSAINEDERRRYQWNEPAGREKTLFSLLMREALNLPYQRHLSLHLTEADYHLVLCSFQVGIWEAARDAHNCETDELGTSSTHKNTTLLWLNYLDSWRTTTENECQLRQSYFSASASTTESMFSSSSLMLWHISALTLHAPLKLLQDQGCCPRCRSGDAMTVRKNEARLRIWTLSPSARTSVWNAAQIFRIFARESNPTPSPRLLLNPLATTAILKSAIVICSYAYHTRACPFCTGGPPIDLVDLFGAEDEDERLVKWKRDGEGLGDWTPGGFPICRCKLMTLAKWFREVLATDKDAETEFMKFLRKLVKVH